MAVIATSLILYAQPSQAEFGKQLDCLTQNIYFEARGESVIGQLAVGLVTLNRVKDRRWPNTICAVTKQANKDAKGNVILNQCQFSWYCDGNPDTVPNSPAAQLARDIAFLLLTQDIKDFTKGSNYFHATYVKPAWRHHMEMTIAVGDHIFYRRD
jgi:spore germination cell wall hydrolase CwlJ-like protein